MVQTQASKTTKLTLTLLETEAANQIPRINENIKILNSLAQLSIKDKDLTAPPGSPAEDDAYIVAAAPTGAWAGQAKSVAVYINAAWYFIAPVDGWMARVVDEAKYYNYNGSNWVEYTPGATTAPTWTVVSKTANFTASTSEAAIYLIDATSGNITVTMPSASSMGSRAFMFKRIDSTANTVTIDANASETIDGQLTLELPSQYDSATLASSGSNLYIL